MPKTNWLAVVGGAGTLVLIVISMFVPWWQFTIGSGNSALAQANFSPVNLNVSVFNEVLTVPLIMALNIAALLSLAAGGIIMLIYSAVPNKPYSKKLIGFGYNKTLLAVILFVVELVALVVLTKSLVGFDVPLMGPALVQLPQSITQGTSISVNVTATFGWSFYFAVAVAVVCVAARLYHVRVATQDPLQSPPHVPA